MAPKRAGRYAQVSVLTIDRVDVDLDDGVDQQHDEVVSGIVVNNPNVDPFIEPMEGMIIDISRPYTRTVSTMDDVQNCRL